MRHLLIASLVAAAPLCSAQSRPDTAPAPVEIVQQEQHLWTTFAEGSFNEIKDLFAHDYIQVDSRIDALDAKLIFLKHCRLSSYELRDLQVRILTPDSAVTAYHVVSSYTCDDAKTVRQMDQNASTVWVREPGSTRWLAELHTETAADPHETDSVPHR